MTPSRTSRSDFLAAVDRPFSRSQCVAFSRSPPLSSSARLQSMTPAPVCSRSRLTSSGVITVVVIVPSWVRWVPCHGWQRMAPPAGLTVLFLFERGFLVLAAGLRRATCPCASFLVFVILRLGLKHEGLAGRKGGAVIGLIRQDRLIVRWQCLGLLELLVELRLAFIQRLEHGIGHLGGAQLD